MKYLKTLFILGCIIPIIAWMPIPTQDLGDITFSTLNVVKKDTKKWFKREVKMVGANKKELSFDVEITWDSQGKFSEIKGTHGYVLQKYNGKVLNAKQLQKLNKILTAPASRFSELKLHSGSAKANENELYEIDAYSGASVKDKPKLEWISGAGELCYVLWNIVHGETVQEITSFK
ncbi:hypothetical protein K5X82_11615 [Halosquirtibacter xylanolyticus]|uniref:hypothetical protein n=1 Tax=Halosquirtibacter xylanolyticus TaxID=3374599 RepID=UPI003747C21F|nr:hypothetical protein K5X82_11615 [Prolixibacteraceae bacterium]